MIWMILALAAAPQIAPEVEASRPFALPFADMPSLPAPREFKTAADSGVMCENSRLQQATMDTGEGDAAPRQWFSDQNRRIYAAPVGQVRLYSAMTLSVGGCSMPVVALDRVPAADRSVGRVVGGRLRD